MSDASQFQTILSAIVEFRSELMLQVVQVREQLTGQIVQVREELTGQIAQVREELVQTRAKIMKRIDRLRNQVTTMRDDLWLTHTHSDRIEKKVDDELGRSQNMLRSISEELSGVHRQIHHLQNDVRTLKGEA